MRHLGGGGAPQGRGSEVLGTGRAAVVKDICIFKYIFCANMWCDGSGDACAVATYVRFLFDLFICRSHFPKNNFDKFYIKKY
jgi:hypothetical protein